MADKKYDPYKTQVRRYKKVSGFIEQSKEQIALMGELYQEDGQEDLSETCKALYTILETTLFALRSLGSQMGGFVDINEVNNERNNLEKKDKLLSESN